MSASKSPLPVSQYANVGAPIRAHVHVGTLTNVSATPDSGTKSVVYTAIEPTVVDHLDIAYDTVVGTGGIRVKVNKVTDAVKVADSIASGTLLQVLESGALADFTLLADDTGPIRRTLDFTGVVESSRLLARGDRLVVTFYSPSAGDEDATHVTLTMLGRTNRN